MAKLIFSQPFLGLTYTKITRYGLQFETNQYNRNALNDYVAVLIFKNCTNFQTVTVTIQFSYSNGW